MGTVYKARDRKLDDIVALKMLNPAMIADPDYLERMKSEIRLAPKPNPPHVLPAPQVVGGLGALLMLFGGRARTAPIKLLIARRRPPPGRPGAPVLPPGVWRAAPPRPPGDPPHQNPPKHTTPSRGPSPGWGPSGAPAANAARQPT